MKPLTLSSVISALTEQNLQPNHDEDTDQACVIFDMHQTMVPLFYKVSGERKMLQLCIVFPFNFEEKTRSDTARFLHMLNRDLDLPGFGMDEDLSTLHFRTSFSCKDQKLDIELLELYTNACKEAAVSFYSSLNVIATGQMTLAQMILESEKVRKIQV